MADKISAERRSANMSRIRAKDTKPEMAVRRVLHSLGYRYQLHRRDLPGVPDIVFPGRRKVIDVRGCFWHQHEGCQDGRAPKSRKDYWGPKLHRNVQRGAEALERLQSVGWATLVLWECEAVDLEAVTTRVTSFLGAARAARRSD